MFLILNPLASNQLQKSHRLKNRDKMEEDAGQQGTGLDINPSKDKADDKSYHKLVYIQVHY